VKFSQNSFKRNRKCLDNAVINVGYVNKESTVQIEETLHCSNANSSKGLV